MPAKITFFCLSLMFAFSSTCLAHFGLLIPSRSMVLNQKEAAIDLDIAFAHPFAGIGMPMQKPKAAFVWLEGTKENLELSPATYLQQPAFAAKYIISRPGLYQIGVEPEPYYEPAEDRYIIHYAKTVIAAFGHGEGWEKPVGFPVEIVPLTRPFGNYACNTFSAIVLKNGKPLANADVEVEFLNSEQSHIAPNPWFVTQAVKTDAFGQFTFGIPWPGWWGFAALTEAEEGIDHNGSRKTLELGGIIWLEFYAPEMRK